MIEAKSDIIFTYGFDGLIHINVWLDHVSYINIWSIIREQSKYQTTTIEHTDY